MSKEMKMAILKDLIGQMRRKEGKCADKSPMDIAKLESKEEEPASEELAEEAPDEMREMLREFFKGGTKLPEASGVTVEVVSAEPMAKMAPKEKEHKGSSIPMEGTKQMLKEFLKSKKMGKFA